MELPDEQMQKPQEKLGRLQYKIDYDFAQNNVSCFFVGRLVSERTVCLLDSVSIRPPTRHPFYLIKY